MHVLQDSFYDQLVLLPHLNQPKVIASPLKILVPKRLFVETSTITVFS